jgi:hypothetical protein
LDALKDETLLKAYTEDMSNRLSELNTIDSTANERWEQCKNTIIKSSEDILGTKEIKRNEGWYNKECKDATEKKNEAYRKMTQRCRTGAMA